MLTNQMEGIEKSSKDLDKREVKVAHLVWKVQ